MSKIRSMGIFGIKPLPFEFKHINHVFPSKVVTPKKDYQNGIEEVVQYLAI